MPTRENSSGRRPTRVLLAEADQTSLTHLSQLLSRIGYEVVIARDGLEAAQILVESADPPSLAILDWTMPGLNGTDVCRGIRSSPHRKSTYVVLLTDWSQKKDRLDALEEGADDCLGKPVDVRELRVRLQVGSQTILERALRESEERLRGAFEYAGTGMALAKITGEFLQVNPALSEFLGYTEDELMTMGVHAIGHPDNQPTSAHLLDQFLKSGRRSAEYEREFLTKNGKTTWALITLSTVLDGDQNVTCFFVQFNDITQRKVAEAALQRSEALFRAIMNNVSDLILVRDLDYKCRYASPSYSQLGYGIDELLGNDMQAIVHAEDREEVERTFVRVRDDQQARVLTCRCQHKNGTSLHVESSISLLRESRGAPDGLVVVSRVVEDRIQAAQRLQAANAETELFLQSIPSVLVGLDGEGRITRWNPTAAETFGASGAQVIGRRIDDCGIEWSQSDIHLEVNRWLKTESACRSELGFQRQGQTRFLGAHVRPIPAVEPGAKRLLLTGADITERKELEEQPPAGPEAGSHRPTGRWSRPRNQYPHPICRRQHPLSKRVMGSPRRLARTWPDLASTSRPGHSLPGTAGAIRPTRRTGGPGLPPERNPRRDHAVFGWSATGGKDRSGNEGILPPRFGRKTRHRYQQSHRNHHRSGASRMEVCGQCGDSF